MVLRRIADAIDCFVADVCAGKVNETPNAYRTKLRRLSGWMDHEGLHLRDLKPDHIRQFNRAILEKRTKRSGAKVIQAPLSPFTIRTALVTVRHFLKWAAANGMCRADLWPCISMPKLPTPEPKAVAADAVIRILQAAASTGAQWERARNLALIYVLRDTGARIGGIINADIDDLDLKARRILVRTKGGRVLHVFLNPPTMAALREWLRYRPELKPKEQKLFISYRGRGLRRSSVYSLIERIKHHAPGVIQGRANPHAYRHAWARDALTAGEDISKVARTLGNSVRVTADYYALWNDHEIQEAHGKYSPGAKLPLISPQPD